MAGEEVEMLVTKLSLTTTRCLRGFPISQDIKVLSIRKSRVALLFLKTKFCLRSLPDIALLSVISVTPRTSNHKI